MTDFRKTLDDSQRDFVANKRKQAAEHPFNMALAVLLGMLANTLILHRIGKQLGLPLRRLHWWILLGAFGRDPGYPYNLIWQQPGAVKVTKTTNIDYAKEVQRAMLKQALRNQWKDDPPEPRRRSEPTSPADG